MDLTRRTMLNDFGLVQHAVFESDDLSAVHVIYDRNQKHFVHTEVTKELQARTGLQLVPTQSRVATSSSKGDGVVIVLVDRHDSPFTDSFLREAVETAGHPDTHILFLQKGEYRPDWVNKIPRSALMLYPRSVNERPQFWNTVSSAIGQCAGVQSILFVVLLPVFHFEYFSTVLLHCLHYPIRERVYMHECFD